ALIERYGEIGRVLRHVPHLSSDQVAERILGLHKKHALEVTGVMDEAFRAHVADILEGRLSPTCAIILAVPENYRVDSPKPRTVNTTSQREAQPEAQTSRADIATHED